MKHCYRKTEKVLLKVHQFAVSKLDKNLGNKDKSQNIKPTSMSNRPGHDVKRWPRWLDDCGYSLPRRWNNPFGRVRADCSHGNFVEGLFFSKMDLSLLRLIWTGSKTFRKFGPKWSYLFAAYAKMLPPLQKKFFSKIICRPKKWEDH